MKDMRDLLDVKNVGLFVGGLLFGTAGLKILSSKDEKKFTQTVQQLFFVQKTV